MNDIVHLYSIYDKLLEYYNTPFVGHTRNAVLAAVATTVNNKEIQNEPLVQAPHQFEVWEVGTFDQAGNLHARKTFIANCSTLVRAAGHVRGNLRKGDGESVTPEAQPPAGAGRAQPGGTPRRPATLEPFTPEAMAPEETPAGNPPANAPGGSSGNIQ